MQEYSGNAGEEFALDVRCRRSFAGRAGGFAATWTRPVQAPGAARRHDHRQHGSATRGPADVVVEGGRISVLKRVGTPGLPIEPARRPAAGDFEIDCAGMTPGFIDCHAYRRAVSRRKPSDAEGGLRLQVVADAWRHHLPRGRKYQRAVVDASAEEGRRRAPHRCPPGSLPAPRFRAPTTTSRRSIHRKPPASGWPPSRIGAPKG
jgi:hypothetical protein